MVSSNMVENIMLPSLGSYKILNVHTPCNFGFEPKAEHKSCLF